MSVWISRARPIEVTCLLDIEITPESFHAHAVPEGVDLAPGDTVILHDVSIADLTFGAKLTRRCRASLYRAGLIRRAWTRLTSLLELTELYEVGFASAGELGFAKGSIR